MLIDSLKEFFRQKKGLNARCMHLTTKSSHAIYVYLIEEKSQFGAVSPAVLETKNRKM